MKGEEKREREAKMINDANVMTAGNFSSSPYPEHMKIPALALVISIKANSPLQSSLCDECAGSL